MKNNVLCLIAALFCYGNVQAFHMSIEGPTTVCPNVEQTYRVNFSPRLVNCSYSWSIKDQNGVQVAISWAPEITFTFPSPQNQTYTVTVTTGTGIGCLIPKSKTISVTTRYPKPSLSGPRQACPGGSVDITGTVNAEFECFHHRLDWRVPGGWSYTTFGGVATISIPANTPTGKYAIYSRVHYNDINEYGDFVKKEVWVGPPVVSGLGHPATFGCTMGEIHAFTDISATSYEWKVSGGTIVESGTDTYTGGESIFVDPVDGPYGFTVQVRASNVCGKSAWFSKNIPTQCSPSGSGPGTILRSELKSPANPSQQVFDIQSIYPNPANDKVFINLGVADDHEEQTYCIEVYDLSGNVLLKTQTEGINASLDVSSLKDGMHILQLSGTAGTVRKRLMVRH